MHTRTEQEQYGLTKTFT